MRILLLDNYDSFTFNLMHYLAKTGAEVIVKRNDEISCSEIQDLHPQGILTGPGPCSPSENGQLMEVTATFSGEIPLLGVCLGMQAIGLHFGWELSKAKKPVHGKSSLVTHNGKELFDNIPSPMEVGRYHSLVVVPNDNSELMVTGTCEGEVMSVQHSRFPIWGVQFHPESILTPNGQKLIDNWVMMISKSSQ